MKKLIAISLLSALSLACNMGNRSPGQAYNEFMGGFAAGYAGAPPPMPQVQRRQSGFFIMPNGQLIHYQGQNY